MTNSNVLQFTKTPNRMRTMYDLGFTRIVPVIPVGAELFEGANHPDGSWEPGCDLDAKSFGKTPGSLRGTKWTRRMGWPEYKITPDDIAAYDAACASVGWILGEDESGIDVDVTDPELAGALLNGARGILPVLQYRVGLSPKFMIPIKLPNGPVPYMKITFSKEGRPDQHVEVLSKGKQVIIAGIHPTTGREYEWFTNPSMPGVQDIPVPPSEAVCPSIEPKDMIHALEVAAAAVGWQRGRTITSGGKEGSSELNKYPPDPDLASRIMEYLPNPPGHSDYELWMRVGMALKLSLGDAGFEVFNTWSQKCPKYWDEGEHKYRGHDDRNTIGDWKGFKPDGRLGWGTIVHHLVDVPADLEAERKADLNKRRTQAVFDTMPDISNFVPPTVEPKEPVLVPAAGADGEVIGTYVYKGDGYTKAAISHNVMLELVTSPVWEGVFRYDLFAGQMSVVKPLPDHPTGAPFTPRFLTDADYLSVHTWCQQQIGWTTIAKQAAVDGLDAARKHVSYDPLVDYLNGLPSVPVFTMPGVGLLSNWLFQYMGVDPHIGDPPMRRYLSQIGRKWLISAVARALDPGCQVDSAIVLEGPQGGGKSSALAILAVNPDWFGDSLPDFHKADASLYLRGKWIVELSELTNVLKSEIEVMRKFVTRRIEKYRPPYGRVDAIEPRRCVLAGSTNRSDYLRDPDGERRMWPVVVGTCDLDGLRAARDQLWAEAVAAYRAGETWHLDEADAVTATQVQKSKKEVDSWHDIIKDGLDGKIDANGNRLKDTEPSLALTVFTPQMGARWIGIPADKWNRATTDRIIAIALMLGWVKDGRMKTTTYRDGVKLVRTL